MAAGVWPVRGNAASDGMNGFTAVSELTSRIATLTSISRTTREDAARHERHNNGKTLDDAIAEHVAALRKMARDLEKTVL